MAVSRSRRARDRRTRFELWATCTDCGDVVVPAEQCVLYARGSDHAVAFPCSTCGRRDTVPVDDDDVETLMAAGFVTRRIEVPRESRPVGAPFVWDDVLDLHELLARESRVVALLD